MIKKKIEISTETRRIYFSGLLRLVLGHFELIQPPVEIIPQSDVKEMYFYL